jgi:hypothetical protein
LDLHGAFFQEKVVPRQALFQEGVEPGAGLDAEPFGQGEGFEGGDLAGPGDDAERVYPHIAGGSLPFDQL